MKVYTHTSGEQTQDQRTFVGEATTYKDAVDLACQQYESNYLLFDEYAEQDSITFSFAA